MFASSLAHARTFNATLNAVDSNTYWNATATVNYNSRTLTLSLQPRMPACPEGHMCIQAFPPAATMTYKRVKSVMNKCGVITTTAHANKTQIVLVNNSQNICENEPELIASLELKNRQGLVVDAFASARDLSVFLQGSSVGRYIGGNLVLNRAEGNVNLSLQPVMPECPEGNVCAQVMPPSVELFFSNSVTVTNSCGVVQTTTGVVYEESTKEFHTVMINDNRNNTCPTLLPLAAWDIIVRSSQDTSFSETSVIEVDQLRTEELN
jgi:hypothetical protein